MVLILSFLAFSFLISLFNSIYCPVCQMPLFLGYQVIIVILTAGNWLGPGTGLLKYTL